MNTHGSIFTREGAEAHRGSLGGSSRAVRTVRGGLAGERAPCPPGSGRAGRRGSPRDEFRDPAAAEISWVQRSRLCWNLLWSRHKLIITLLLEAASCIINVCWRQEGLPEKLLLPRGPTGRGDPLCWGQAGLTLTPVALMPASSFQGLLGEDLGRGSGGHPERHTVHFSESSSLRPRVTGCFCRSDPD